MKMTYRYTYIHKHEDKHTVTEYEAIEIDRSIYKELNIDG